MWTYFYMFLVFGLQNVFDKLLKFQFIILKTYLLIIFITFF